MTKDDGFWPKTEKEFLDYMRKLLSEVQYPTDEEMKYIWDPKNKDTKRYKEIDKKMADGYNKSAEVMWKIAVAAFNYAAKEVGASGFQAGWAVLKFVEVVDGIRGPFGIMKAEDFIYPQYGTPEEKAAEWHNEWIPWLAEEAAKNMQEVKDVHPVVRDHWKKLVNLKKKMTK